MVGCRLRNLEKPNKNGLSTFSNYPTAYHRMTHSAEFFLCLTPRNFRVVFSVGISQKIPGDVIPIDGKTLRRSYD